MAAPELKGKFESAAGSLWDQDAIRKAWDAKLNTVAATNKANFPKEELARLEATMGSERFKKADDQVKAAARAKYEPIAKEYVLGDLVMNPNNKQGKPLTTADVVQRIKELPDSAEVIKAKEGWRRNIVSHTPEPDLIPVPSMPEGWKITKADEKFLSDKRRYDGPGGTKTRVLEDLRDSMDKRLDDPRAAEPSDAEIRNLRKNLEASDTTPQEFANIYGATSLCKYVGDDERPLSETLAKRIATQPIPENSAPTELGAGPATVEKYQQPKQSAPAAPAAAP